MENQQQNIVNESNDNQKNKKPYYKKWWFYVIIFFIAVTAINAGSSSGTKKNETTQTQTKQTETKKVENEKKTPKIGEKFTYGGIEWTISNMQKKTGILGEKIITFDVKASNTSTKNQFISSSTFKLIDTNGTVLDSTITEKTNALFKELPAGTNSSGEIAFKDNGTTPKEIQMTQLFEENLIIPLQ